MLHDDSSGRDHLHSHLHSRSRNPTDTHKGQQQTQNNEDTILIAFTPSHPIQLYSHGHRVSLESSTSGMANILPPPPPPPTTSLPPSKRARDYRVTNQVRKPAGGSTEETALLSKPTPRANTLHVPPSSTVPLLGQSQHHRLRRHHDREAHLPPCHLRGSARTGEGLRTEPDN